MSLLNTLLRTENISEFGRDLNFLSHSSVKYGAFTEDEGVEGYGDKGGSVHEHRCGNDGPYRTWLVVLAQFPKLLGPPGGSRGLQWDLG
jgi:hypothetical protein